MALGSILLQMVIIGFAIFLISLILRKLKQPQVVSYILGGILLGPYGLKIINDPDLLHTMGELGIILLLFFLGMEVCVPCIAAKWRVTIGGTLIQIIFSILAVSLAGVFFHWDFNTIVLLGFVISLSSTAVVLKVLRDKNELNTKVGQNVIGILIVQDIAVVPIIIALNLLNGNLVNYNNLWLNLIGGIFFISLVVITFLFELKIPFKSIIKRDHEMQVFLAFLLCFGMAAVAIGFGLSPAMGAFIAGVLLASWKETSWVSKSLHPFYIVFTALFFVYIGMLINLELLVNMAWIVTALILAVFIINTCINMLIFKVLGDSWKESLYGGALLSQIGEFSFILGAIGLESHLITQSGYDLVILIISLTLLLSPFWIWAIRKWTKVKCKGNICTFG